MDAGRKAPDLSSGKQSAILPSLSVELCNSENILGERDFAGCSASAFGGCSLSLSPPLGRGAGGVALPGDHAGLASLPLAIQRRESAMVVNSPAVGEPAGVVANFALS